GRVRKLDIYPVGSGGSADIYAGSLGHLAPVTPMPPHRVAIKIYCRMLSESQELEQTSKTLYKAAQSWSALYDPNVLPFLGVSLDLGLSPALIAPLCPSGPIMKYFKMSAQDPTERLQMVLGIASGLQFLHENGVVHGDLKVTSTIDLIHGTPCICDFGISRIVSLRGFAASNVRTAPYTTPELFFVLDALQEISQASLSPSTTKSSDVYSFALLVLEILTTEPPKARPSRPIGTAKIIIVGLRPKREDYDERAVARGTWAILDQCWSLKPFHRPGATVGKILFGFDWH
ncbi:kinase-like domain-containing protein, partial [Mycena olivaceomarginata]